MTPSQSLLCCQSCPMVSDSCQHRQLCKIWQQAMGYLGPAVSRSVEIIATLLGTGNQHLCASGASSKRTAVYGEANAQVLPRLQNRPYPGLLSVSGRYRVTAPPASWATSGPQYPPRTPASKPKVSGIWTGELAQKYPQSARQVASAYIPHCIICGIGRSLKKGLRATTAFSGPCRGPSKVLSHDVQRCCSC